MTQGKQKAIWFTGEQLIDMETLVKLTKKSRSLIIREALTAYLNKLSK